MNILYIVPRFPVPSETFIASEIIAVRRQGHQVNIAALVKPSRNELQKMGPEMRSIARDVVYINKRTLVIALCRLLFNFPNRSVISLNMQLQRVATIKARSNMRLLRAFAIAQLAQRLKVTHIHAHWPRPTEVALLTQKMTNLSLSISIHAHEVAHDAGHFCLAFEHIRFATFCNLAAMKHLLQQLPNSARTKCHLLYHGVNLQAFRPKLLPVFDGTLRVISAGRMTPTKGFDRLLKVVKLSLDHGVSVELNLVGDGTQRKHLEQMAHQLGISPYVTFSGWIHHEHIQDTLSQAHIFVLLADDNFHDGLPNVILEAQAIGRPVILSPLPAAKEAIVNGINGRIISHVDALDEVVQIFKQLMDDPQELDSMSQSARTFVEVHHDREEQINNLCDLFLQVGQDNRINLHKR